MAATEAPWLETASGDVGLKEVPGRGNNPRIVSMFAAVGHPEVKSDAVAWCAAYVGSVLKLHDLPIPDADTNLLARSYCTYGTKCEPRSGAIAVWKRGNSSWQGHVNVVKEVRVYKGKTQVRCIGGNQNNAVTLTNWQNADSALAFRWPPVPGEKPEPVKPVIQTAVRSKSAWAQFMAMVTAGVAYLTDWLSVAWHWISDIMTSSPEIVGAAGATIGSAKTALSWVDIPWTKVGFGVVMASMAVVLVRHVQDKRRVPWD